ncbi:nucleoside-binding protein [Brevibacterium sanguinis]|uniref:Nucleoside-binding protein n=2 Tax=Brevibacterium TaxID=1696 RepID=A0A366IQN7_9MICO|nr:MULTISPECIES: BMP family ABC transporter substrate-binding protein [Brevibacterium]RBP68146.1 nucleoside-binding protein [Brevibacterium sanguinis]RBP74437.1 nucleoside-binding protein [Brevibacterium celere]
MKKLASAVSIMAASALVLSACGSGEGDSSAGGEDFLACMVSDQGGWDDQSFNQSGRAGLQAAVENFGIQEKLAESQGDADYTPNVDNMVQQGCNLTFGVGFLLEDAIQEAAEANPDLSFALIDSTFSDADGKPVTLENAKPLVFNTAEAAYLAGYVAAAMSESGKVGTFGGIQIPSVTVFMDGFADGVKKFNEDNGKNVELLGWDKEKQDGSFSGDFENQGQGQELTKQLISQGADVVMPVAGPVGLGAAAAAKESGKTKIVWVDTDGYESTEYGDIILTSVVKQIANAVEDTVGEAVEDKFSAEPYVGTLENEGVGLAPFHDFEDDVPEDVKKKVDELKQQIIDGTLTVESENSPK